MQSTGQTSTHASQPVQLSARTTASALGTFFLALPAPFAMTLPRSGYCRGRMVFPNYQPPDTLIIRGFPAKNQRGGRDTRVDSGTTVLAGGRRFASIECLHDNPASIGGTAMELQG